jgi:hypothetical protein
MAIITRIHTNEIQYCCDQSYFHNTYSPNPHAEEDRVTKVGETVDCEMSSESSEPREFSPSRESAFLSLVTLALKQVVKTRGYVLVRCKS